jgi:hypothetical protein
MTIEIFFKLIKECPEFGEPVQQLVLDLMSIKNDEDQEINNKYLEEQFKGSSSSQ